MSAFGCSEDPDRLVFVEKKMRWHFFFFRSETITFYGIRIIVGGGGIILYKKFFRNNKVVV